MPRTIKKGREQVVQQGSIVPRGLLMFSAQRKTYVAVLVVARPHTLLFPFLLLFALAPTISHHSVLFIE